MIPSLPLFNPLTITRFDPTQELNISISPEIQPISSNSSFRKFQAETSSQKINTTSTLEKVYVGELHEKWQFPSDHLPIGATVGDFDIVSWNVLNKIYMSWVYNNSQGLSNSLLTQEDIIIKENGLTLRDQHVISSILEMINHESNPKSVLSLQECGEPFLQELQALLPENFKILLSSNSAINQDIIIYDQTKFNLLEKNIDFNAYPCDSGRPIMNVLLEKDGIKYRFFNAHVPGNPNLPGRYEFADYVFNHKQDDEVTIALGDLNFEPKEMDHAFEVAASAYLKDNHFQRLSPYRTNVGLDFCSKAIDHIFIDTGIYSIPIQENQPNEVLKDLEKTTPLLEIPFIEIIDYPPDMEDPIIIIDQF